MSTVRLLVIAAMLTGTITEAYSLNLILKKSAKTILTKSEATSGKLAVSAIKLAAITNANVATGVNPSAGSIAITIGVKIIAE